MFCKNNPALCFRRPSEKDGLKPDRPSAGRLSQDWKDRGGHLWGGLQGIPINVIFEWKKIELAHFQGRNKRTNEIVAMKKIRLESEDEGVRVLTSEV